MIVPDDMIEHTTQIFNSLHDRIQFTLEKGEGINFLDLTLILSENNVTTDWFHKETFSGRYLNFYSQHPLSQKRGTVVGLVDRVFHLSDPIFHEKNINLVINILLDNCYPLEFIFRIINERLKFLIHKHNHSTINNEIPLNAIDNNEEDNSTSYFVLPFVGSVRNDHVRNGHG